MASNLGTVFVELSLDDKVYKQKLSETLTSSQATAKGVETAFKALGVKTEASFDAQRRAAENAFTLIKNSAISTANDRLRAEEAMHQKITALNEQQYGKQVSLLTTMKGHWIAASVAIAAAGAFAAKAWNLARQGAEFEEQKGILDNLARKYAMTADQIVKSMEEASEGLIAQSDLMLVALGGLTKGLKPDQLIALADAAAILGDAVGKDATTALKELTEALESGRTKGLKGYLGTTLDLESAFGDLASKMTAAEKTQAMYMITVLEASKIQVQQTGHVDTAADRMEKLDAQYKNLTLSVAQWAKSMVVGLADVVQAAIETSARISDAEAGIFTPTEEKPAAAEAPQDKYQKQIDALTKQIEAFKALLKARVDDDDFAKKAEQKRIQATEQITEDIRKQAFEIEAIGQDAQEKEISRILQQIDAFEKAGVKQVTIQKWVDGEMEKISAQANADIAKNNLKFLNDKSKMQSDQIKDGQDIAEKGTEAGKKLLAERLKAERDLYKDIRGYETEAYAATLDLISEQAKKYRELKVSEVAIQAWVRQETINAYIKMGQASNDWKKGTMAALLELKQNFTTWGKVAYDVVKGFATNAQSTLSTVFFDFFTGELKTFKDYWDSFWKSMLKIFSDILAKMVADWLTAQAIMAANNLLGTSFSAPGTTGGGVAGTATNTATNTLVNKGINAAIDYATGLFGGGAAGGATGAGAAALSGALGTGGAAAMGYGGTLGVSSTLATTAELGVPASYLGTGGAMVATEVGGMAAGEGAAVGTGAAAGLASVGYMAIPVAVAAIVTAWAEQFHKSPKERYELAYNWYNNPESRTGGLAGRPNEWFYWNLEAAEYGVGLRGPITEQEYPDYRKWMIDPNYNLFTGEMMPAPDIMASSVHTGGTIGYDPLATRVISAEAFAGAPRLHYGLAEDEYPAILQKGEKVIPKDQVGKDGGITINLYATYADSNALNEFAEVIYTKVDKLQRWGH